MSKRTQLLVSLIGASSRAAGSHLTREARTVTASSFTEFCSAQNIQIADVTQIRTSHIQDYFGWIAGRGLDRRTSANRAAHLREMLRASGKGTMVDLSELSNKALGISGASRSGTNGPLTVEQLVHVRDEALRTCRQRYALALEIQLLLGLRSMEVLRHGTAARLREWIHQVRDTGCVEVCVGTKGGRSRRQAAIDPSLTAVVLTEALALAVAQGGCLLTPENLSKAEAAFRNWMHRRGVKRHAARYWWAEARAAQLIASGRELVDAWRVVSTELGHGMGRHYHCRAVYGCRGAADVAGVLACMRSCRGMSGASPAAAN